MLEKFSEHLSQALRRAVRSGVDRVLPSHLLLAILEEDRCRAVALLRNLRVNFDVLRKRLGETRSTPGSGREASIAPATTQVLTLAEDLRRWLADRKTGTEHVLLALLLRAQSASTDLPDDLGLDPARAYDHILTMLATDGLEPETPEIEAFRALKSLSHEQIHEALEIQRNQGGLLEDILVALGHLSREQVARLLSLNESIGSLPLKSEIEIEDPPGGTFLGLFENLDSASKLLSLMLSTALSAESTDVHFERFEECCKIRYRVDGVLYEMESPPLHLATMILDILKKAAGLDPTPSKLPQEARMRIKHLERRFEVDLSVLPTVEGESTVLRFTQISSG